VFPFDKAYSMNPTEGQLQADPNLSKEMETVEFKLSVLHTLLNAYQEFLHRGQLPIPEKCLKSRKLWIDVEPNLMESFKTLYEITNNPKDRVESYKLVDWIKTKGVSMTKLGRDINEYADKLNFTNVKSTPKKISGKTVQCWVGIREIPLEEEEPVCSVLIEGDPAMI
jgi:DNA primase